MDASEGSAIEDLWTPYKELVSVVEGYLAREGGNAPYAVHTFEAVLRRHKQTFLALLKNPTKNPTSREEIKRGISEGVNLPSIGRTLLSKELVDEAIIISDMYNVNEYLALELLHTAQRQAPRHPGLPRGLIAVLLYYDGRNCCVRALKQLLMARDGISWSISARPEIITYVSRYVDQLISDGLLGNTLDALSKYNLPAELELLQNNRALPPKKHHKRLIVTIDNTRKYLAGVVFAASAQRGLGRDILLRLLSEQTKAPTYGPNGALDDISLSLQMALLYALDLSILYRREDGEELAKKLPLLSDPGLISVLLEELLPPTNPNQTQPIPEKCSGGVRALCQLSLGLALAALKRAPQSLQRVAPESLLEADEALLDAATDGKVFEYLEEKVLANETSTKEEYYQRRLHTLLTDFIVLMHSKLMEMRLKSDEAVRAVQMYAAEGLQSPATARTQLDSFLRCIESLYRTDPLNLRDDYWQMANTHSTSYRAGGRAASLYKFVRMCAGAGGGGGGRAGAWLAGAAALSAAPAWPLLARPAHTLLAAHAHYLANLRTDPSPLTSQPLASSLGACAVTPRAKRMLVRQEEVEAMIAAQKLVASVARIDQSAACAICENLQWDAVNVMFGLMCCQIPLNLKVSLCNTLAALGSWPSTAPRVWAALEAAQLVSADVERRGLEAELIEVECRLEEYPLTRAFLNLLLSLTSAGPLPRTLGAGTRPPGLYPYARYVINHVVLPAPHRAYSNSNEKWKVLSSGLKLLHQWLEGYTPSPGDMPRDGAPSPAPPGLFVALQLHTDGELLPLLFSVMYDAEQMMYQLMDSDLQSHVEECLLLTLRLVDVGLSIERALFEGHSVPLIGLSKLILGGSGSPAGGYLRAAAQAVAAGAGGAAWAAAACAVRVLARAPRQHLAHTARHGFVECLEAEEWAESEHATALRECKEGVVSLILQLLPTGAPNFAHYLLGFPQTEHISGCLLHEAGVAGAPRSCLHAVLDLLEQHIAPPHNANREASDLIELCYRLLYSLVANPNTSAPVLRLLRARDNLLVRHYTATIHLETASSTSISARSWVLRSAAVACGAASSQRPLLQPLLRAAACPPPDHTQEYQYCLLLNTLEAPVTVAGVREPRWELLRSDQLRQCIASTEAHSGMGGKRISVSRLHALLTREMATLQATAAQKNMLNNEIQKVLDYVTEVNKQRNLAATLTHYYDSWRQLTEILFCVAPYDLLPLEPRKTLLLNILQELLNKIPPAEVLPQIGNLASGTVLLLLVNLRHCYILQKRESNLKSSDFETTFFGPSTQIMQSKSLTLKFILHKILSWILVAGGSTQKMRVNLYGALLNYLNIVNLKTSPAELDTKSKETYVSRLDSSFGPGNKEESALKSMVIDVISGFGDNLCSVVCSDCISGGHDVCRMVALSCLETLVDINPQTDWMATLTNQGYLRSLIDSLLQDDEGLKQALEANPKSLRVLYVYESKMALLSKICQTRVGAETVLAQGALSCLANMSVLDCHPDIHTGYGSHQDTDFLPSVANRFRQILIPALSLCDALLTVLGTHNHSCVLHVTHLLLSHADCLDVVLRAAHPDSPEGLLIELEAITSVIARSADRQVLEAAAASEREHSPVNALAPAPALRRLRSLLLALLPRFCDAVREPSPLLYKIMCNLLTYARNITSPAAPSSLFPPSLGGEAGEGAGAGAGAGVAAALRALQAAVRESRAADKLLLNTDASRHYTLEDMKKLLPPEEIEGRNLSPSEVRAAAAALLGRRRDARRRRRAYCRYCAECALHVLWTQLHLCLRASQQIHADNALTPATAIGGAYGDQLSELKKGLVGVFNDRFIEELLDTAKNEPASQRGFLEVLVKDIKSMIQFTPL